MKAKTISLLCSLASGLSLTALGAEGTPPPVPKKAIWGVEEKPETYSAEDYDENAPSPKRKKSIPTPPQDFQIVFGTDYLVSTQSKSKITGSSLNVPVSNSNDGKSLAFSVEGTYQPIRSFWGVTFLMQTAKYRYHNAHRISDRHTGFWIAPRMQGSWARHTLWGSVGFGMMKSTFQKNTYSEGNYRYDVTSSQGSRYSYNLRMGLDFYLTPKREWFMGPQISFTEFTTRNTGRISQINGSNTAPYENEIARNWIALGFKVGLYF